MANHGPSYGFSAEVQKKLASSYDSGLERKISQWIGAVTGESQKGSFQEWLKSGLVLCSLANKIMPGSATGFKSSSMPFVQMENINRALEAFRRIGVQDTEVFMTVDLFEAKNMNAVLLCLAALSRAAEKRGYSGPRMDLSGAAPPQISEYGPGVFSTDSPKAPPSSLKSTPPPVARDAPSPASAGTPRFCPSCGSAWTAGARFCANCGSKAP